MSSSILHATARDRPWSNYFCCMALANTTSCANPVATKRARCVPCYGRPMRHREPDRAVAQRLADFGASYECALMMLMDARYGLWRNTIRKHGSASSSLRLNELGMLKKTPNEVISDSPIGASSTS